MSENGNGEGEGQEQGPAEAQGQAPQGLPELRPHLVVVRQIVYRGDAEAIKGQLLRSLPDGLFFTGAFTIEMKTAPLEEEQPQWLNTVKFDLLQAAKAKQAQAQARSPILSPHTLRPVK